MFCWNFLNWLFIQRLICWFDVFESTIKCYRHKKICDFFLKQRIIEQTIFWLSKKFEIFLIEFFSNWFVCRSISYNDSILCSCKKTNLILLYVWKRSNFDANKNSSTDDLVSDCANANKFAYVLFNVSATNKLIFWITIVEKNRYFWFFV